MAKLVYTHDGPAYLQGVTLEKDKPVQITKELADEIHKSLPDWESRGYKLLEYEAPA